MAAARDASSRKARDGVMGEEHPERAAREFLRLRADAHRHRAREVFPCKTGDKAGRQRRVMKWHIDNPPLYLSASAVAAPEPTIHA